MGNSFGFFDTGGAPRGRNRNIDAFQMVGEFFPVFGQDDGRHRGAEDPHFIFFQNSLFFQPEPAVKRRLSTERKANTVRSLFADDFFHEILVNRQKVNLVGQRLRSLERCDVRIDQNDFFPFFFERLYRLTAGIIKFSGLADFQRATP